MTRNIKYLLPGIALVVALAAVVLSAVALGSQAETAPAAAVPQLVAAVAPTTLNYQGFLTDDQGDPVNGSVNLQFDLFKAASGGISLWSETHNGVTADKGYFAVRLGSQGSPLGAADFKLPAGSSTLYLQVSILPQGGGQIALPRQPLATAPYAFLAEEAGAAPWDGLSGIPPGFADNIDDVEFANVVTVAKSGGQFSSIQEAINSINDASGDFRYLVWVGPGRYDEQVQLKPYVQLVGAGTWMTVIQSGAWNEDIYPPTEATLKLAEYTQVRDLTVTNYGDGFRNVSILGLNGTYNTGLTNVTVSSNGPGLINYGIFLDGVDTSVSLEHVVASASAADDANVGLEVANGADAIVQDGRYRGFNGLYAVGIAGTEPETRLDLFDVDVEAADAGAYSFGLLVRNDAVANVYGGNFEARNAFTETVGISLWSGGIVEASNAVVYGHGSGNANFGLRSVTGSAILHGGTFGGWGGTEAIGIVNSGDSTLEATGVTARAEDGEGRNDGLRNEAGSRAMLNGGFFYGRGYGDSRGLANYDEGSRLDVQQAEIQGDPIDGAGFGVSNEANATAYISHSEIYGTNNVILAEGATTRVWLTKLVGGGVGGGGEAICVAVTFDLSFYPDSCP